MRRDTKKELSSKKRQKKSKRGKRLKVVFLTCLTFKKVYICGFFSQFLVKNRKKRC